VLLILQNDFLGFSATRRELTYLLEWAHGRQHPHHPRKVLSCLNKNQEVGMVQWTV